MRLESLTLQHVDGASLNRDGSSEESPSCRSGLPSHPHLAQSLARTRAGGSRVPQWMQLEASINLAASSGRPEWHLFTAATWTICKKPRLERLITILVKMPVTQIPTAVNSTPRPHRV